MDDIKAALIDLLRESGPAHHQAYIETDGDDPDWPIWYADFLRDRLNALLGAALTKAQFIDLLVELDALQRCEDPAGDWPAFYAEKMLTRYR